MTKHEETGRPEDAAGEGDRMLRRIEAEPVEKFFGRPPHHWLDTPHQWKLPPLRPRSRPTYVPFDAMSAVKKVRRLSQKEESRLPSHRVRYIRRDRLDRFKEALQHQEEGVARMIRTLRDAVERTPDASVDALFALVTKEAPTLRFTHRQMETFLTAIETYVQRHEAVVRARTRYPRDEDLYEACFGMKPAGRVEVIQGPMTLCFRCYDKDDYALAYNFDKAKGDAANIGPADRAHALKSGGCAFERVLLPDLASTVTLENTYYILRPATEQRTLSEAIRHGECELEIDDLRSNLAIDVKGIGTWRVQATAVDAGGCPLRLAITQEGGEAAGFEFTRIQRHRGDRAEFLVREEKGQKKHFAHRISHKLTSAGKTVARISIDFFNMRIEDCSPEGMTLRRRENVHVLVPDEAASQRIRDHEDQHHFNKLFVPAERGHPDRQHMMKNIVGHAESPDDAVRSLLRGLARWERGEIGIDSRARDEVLASYWDGQTTEQIFRNMTTMPHYDYPKKFAQEILQIPERIRTVMQKRVSDVLYRNEPDGRKTFVNAKPVTVTNDEVLEQLLHVLKDEYEQDLQSWLDAIVVLEKKGYDRLDIVSFLKSKPVVAWTAFARRRRAKERS